MKREYEKWKQEYGSLLATFSHKKVLMLFTGGKDSSAVLWLLLQASREFGFSFETHTARYPLQVFSNEEVEKLDTYWRAQGVKLWWHEADASGKSLEEAKLRGENPCRLCQQIKRDCLFKNIIALNYKLSDIVLILSYSLWDLVSYSLEYLVESVYSEQKMNASIDKDRLLRTSQRFYPLIQLSDGLTIFKPLLKYNNQEIFQVVKEQRLPLSEVACAYTRHTPKRILFDYYQQAGARFDYNNVISFVENTFQIHELATHTDMGAIEFVKTMM